MYRTAVLWALALAATLQAAAGPMRTYNGLRAELNAADAVLRIRVTAVQSLDPLPRTADRPPERLRVDLTVVKVLSGSGVSAGENLRVVFPAREYAAWAR